MQLQTADFWRSLKYGLGFSSLISEHPDPGKPQTSSISSTNHGDLLSSVSVVLPSDADKDGHVAGILNGARVCCLVNTRIELTCRQRHNLNLRRSQETLANYLPNAFQDLAADNGKANLFGWSLSYRNRPRKAHSNFTWYDRRFPFTLRLGLPRGPGL